MLDAGRVCYNLEIANHYEMIQSSPFKTLRVFNNNICIWPSKFIFNPQSKINPLNIFCS